MSISHTELIAGSLYEIGARPYAESVYFVEGDDDRSAIMTHLLDPIDGIDDTLFGLPLASIRLEQVDGGTDEQWRAVARYENIANGGFLPSTGTITTFSTGGRTERITQGLSTISVSVPAGRTAPDYNGAIGVTRDGVEGVDIIVQSLRRTERHQILGTTVNTASYQIQCREATGKVNSATFRGFAARTLLLVSVEGRPIVNSAFWEVTFTWEIDVTESSIVIDDITVPTKPPHDYLWVAYEDSDDPAAGKTLRKPAAAVVDRVYGTYDFTTLGI